MRAIADGKIASARGKVLVDIDANDEFVAREASSSKRAGERGVSVRVFPVVFCRGLAVGVCRLGLLSGFSF